MALDQDLKTALDSITGETKSIVADLVKRLEASEKSVRDQQIQLDAVDQKSQHRHIADGGGGGEDPATEICKKLIEQKGDFDRFKRLSFEIKSTLLSTGLFTPQGSDQIGTYDAAPYGQVRSLFRAVPADTGSVFALEEGSSSGWAASPQPGESSPKQESTADLAGRTLAIRTIASFIRISSQAWDDVAGLQEYIRSRLLWALAKKVDEQVIAGDDASQNLRGIVPIAVAFNTALLPSSYDRASILGAAVAQVQIAGFNPNFILLHPTDAYRMRFQRDSTGQYVAVPNLPRIVETVSLAQGTFLIGDSSRALIRVRQQAVVEASDSDGDNFTTNRLTLRAEERMLLQVLSKRAFVTGSLASSPA